MLEIAQLRQYHTHIWQQIPQRKWFCLITSFTLSGLRKLSQGDIAWGGYATAIRAHERFVFPIPDALPLYQAAPMLCAGLTVYAPLVRNGAG